MINKLLRIKAKLVDYYQIVSYDEEAIAYLINLIDYLVLGSIPITLDILTTILEEVLVTSTYHKSSNLLQVAQILNELMEDVKC